MFWEKENIEHLNASYKELDETVRNIVMNSEMMEETVWLFFCHDYQCFMRDGWDEVVTCPYG